jgi:hypothetical protein
MAETPRPKHRLGLIMGNSSSAFDALMRHVRVARFCER